MVANMSNSKPHPMDVHVGRRLRSRRTLIGMSQEELGAKIDVTFQQIQKYERGLNKIGASRLYEIACILNVGVGYFFEEYDVAAPTDTGIKEIVGEDTINALVENGIANTREILNLLRKYYGIPDENVRKKLSGLINALSNYKDVDEEDYLSAINEKESAEIIEFAE